MKLRFKLFIFTLLSVLVLASATTYAVTPTANSEIGNQAALEYVDGAGDHRSMLSNIVITKIGKVYGVDIDPPIHLTGVKDKVTFYVHTVTNIGNTEDSFVISADEFNEANYDILDTDYEAQLPGNNVTLGNNERYLVLGYQNREFYRLNADTTPELKPGESTTIIVAAVGLTAADTQGEFKVHATSVAKDTVADYTIDNLTLSADAIVNVYKTFTRSSGDVEDPFQAIFTFRNASASPAGKIKLTDTLVDELELVNISEATYSIAGSPDYSEETRFVNIDGSVDPGGIAINLDDANDEVTIDIDSEVLKATAGVPGDTDVVIKFWVQAKGTTQAGTYPNHGDYKYADTAGQDFNKAGTTNEVTYTVVQKADVVIYGEDVGEVEQGSLIVFRNYVKNMGNGPDAFDITYYDNEFPAGSDFYLSHYTGEMPANIEAGKLNTYPDVTIDDFDQRTPLIDTNANETVDTGLLEVGEDEIVLLWVQLPLEALGTRIKTDKVATSTYDSAVSNSTTDDDKERPDVCDILPVKVDITNNRYLGAGNNDNGIGKGTGPEFDPVTELALNPGETGYFNLYINNTAEFLDDEYAIDASIDKTFETIELPEGISVTLVSAQGAELTSTGIIKAGGHEALRAKIVVDSTALSKNHDIYFRVRSAQTGAYDIKYDMIKVGIVRNLAIVPTNTGEIYPDSKIVYSHTIINGGNVLEGSGVESSKGLIKLTNTRSNHFTSTCYWDKDKNGVLEKGFDPQLVDLAMEGINGLEPGEEIDVFVEVHSAKTATPGMVNTTKIRLDVNKGIYTVYHPDVSTTDLTTIIEDKLKITKYQALEDSEATYRATDSDDFTKDEQIGSPGDIIYYKIVVENTGETVVEDVRIEDMVPEYTTMVYASENAILSEKAGMPCWRYITKDEEGEDVIGDLEDADRVPAEGDMGMIDAILGELGPEEKAELYFSVRIDGDKQEDIMPDDDPDTVPDNPTNVNP